MDLDYRVIYSRRKTIGLTVERDRSIVVRAPIGASDEAIRQAVEAKKLWLYEKVNHSQKYPPQPVRKEFVTGETLMYLGRFYRLEVTDDNASGVRFHNRFYIARQQQAMAGRLLREWYTARAEEKLTPKIRHFAAAMGVAYERIMISDLRVRWASCTPKNNLNFNWRIVKAPAFVIDYLIVHELAHLLEPNHSERFWNIIAVQIPRYMLAREWLREHGASLEEDLV
ncbi:MAG: SprT family zinc-dependent metalloprotease [Anaerolineae bacterium]